MYLEQLQRNLESAEKSMAMMAERLNGVVRSQPPIAETLERHPESVAQTDMGGQAKALADRVARLNANLESLIQRLEV